MLNLAAAFLTLTTLLTYLNFKLFRLPPAIGVMVNALVLSVGIQCLSWFGFSELEHEIRTLVTGIDFHQLLMQWFLPALLFAGALHVNIDDLKQHKWEITGLATLGVVISTLVVGYSAYYLLAALGMSVSLLYCLVFGALISPTDPIAVMGILKSAGAPKPLRTVIVGESLFNDGTAVVAFSIILSLITLGSEPNVGNITGLFLQEAVGGILFGLALGYVTILLMKTVDEPQLTVMISLAMVIGGSALASHLHLSAPIVIVVAGLMIGNKGRHVAMNDNERSYMDKFWELMDEILNALLFAMIGLELMLVEFNTLHVLAAAILCLSVLMARYATAVPGMLIMNHIYQGDAMFKRGSGLVLAWGGLRGGISVALALALPASPERDVILPITYVIVLCSILVQGLTIGKVVKCLFPPVKS
jgi:CPA1 family monovalent cation:H+ antiporter